MKANAGDSRSVLGVKGRAKPLSFDHKPQNEGQFLLLLDSSTKLTLGSGEKARICAAGGFVDFGRVNGNLALSRAIGDFEFKKSAELSPEQQIVTAFPDVITHSISDDDEFLVIACDGMLFGSIFMTMLIQLDSVQVSGIVNLRKPLSSSSDVVLPQSNSSQKSART